MLEIVVQGRGGQGAQTAGNLLAAAFFAEGREVQAFSTYGGARRGTPVSSYIRVDERPIRLRCDIAHADAILCFDATLLDASLLARARHDTVIVVNSAQPQAQFAARLPRYRVIPVDGIAIARRHGLGRVVNSVLLGALCRMLQAPPLAALTSTIAASAPRLRDENVAACADGHAYADREFATAAA